MADIVITGASRGIGRALALELMHTHADTNRLVLVARDMDRLRELEDEISKLGGASIVVEGDLSSLAAARKLGERLAEEVESGATLVHNAGIWPTKKEIGADGFERAFVVNFLGPMALQRPLLERGLLSRMLVVGAGASALGKLDPARTPTGDDFSRLRTYCTTKLCFAVAVREVARAHPELDVAVVHPGIVQTDLGASTGLLGKLLSLVKRRWEAPEVCAERLARMISQERWSPPGDARWFWEGAEREWFARATDPRVRADVAALTARLLSESKR
jgi:NAD(P)-dependent dehydrogenase (short-subunit alcohol dehydrogenase family)